MLKAFGFFGLTVLLVILVGGCAFFEPKVELMPLGEGESPLWSDLLAEIAKRVPAFGGMFFDKGNLYVYLLDPTQRETVETVIADVFGPDFIPPGGIQVLQGQYSFLQLMEWESRLGASSALPEVAMIYIDNEKNRLRVGLGKTEMVGLVEQELTRLNVPREAVIIEKTGAIWFLSGDQQGLYQSRCCARL